MDGTEGVPAAVLVPVDSRRTLPAYNARIAQLGGVDVANLFAALPPSVIADGVYIAAKATGGVSSRG